MHAGLTRRQTVSTAQILRIARAVAADTRRWQPVLRFDAGKRWYCRLGVLDDHEAWLLSWLPGQHTGWHDHGGSAGVFVVARGALREETVRPGGDRPGSRRSGPGSTGCSGHGMCTT